MMQEFWLPLILGMLASGGLWTLLTKIYERRAAARTSESASEKILRDLCLALAHDRLYELCEEYIERGSVTLAEFDNLTYIYNAYHAAHGNGTGDRLYERVAALPIKGDE